MCLAYDPKITGGGWGWGVQAQPGAPGALLSKNFHSCFLIVTVGPKKRACVWVKQTLSFHHIQDKLV